MVSTQNGYSIRFVEAMQRCCGRKIGHRVLALRSCKMVPEAIPPRAGCKDVPVVIRHCSCYSAVDAEEKMRHYSCWKPSLEHAECCSSQEHNPEDFLLQLGETIRGTLALFTTRLLADLSSWGLFLQNVINSRIRLAYHFRVGGNFCD